MDNSIDLWEFANAPSKFDTCLQGNLQVEILIKYLETRQRYNWLVFAIGPGSYNLTCAVSLPVSFKTVAKLRRLISLPTTIQFNIFGWNSVADGHTSHTLLTGLVADAGKFRRLSCSHHYYIYFLPVATTSLRAGFQVYLSKLWVVDVTKAVRYDLLIYCLLPDIILYFLLVAATSLSSGFSDVIRAARYVCWYIASFLDQGLFLEMWGGWMLSLDVAGVLPEAGDAYSRARTRSQV